MAKVFIKTQGCSHNYSDSEHMAGLLKEAGHELVDDVDSADLVLFNTCTVKTPTENSFLRGLRKAHDKKIVIGGCVPQAEPSRFKDYSLIGTRQLDYVVEVVERTVEGETVQLLQRDVRPRLSIVKERRNPLVETIPVSLGCVSACSFCKTKAARGALSSYPTSEVVDAVRRATSAGVREIWLTSQDTGCYGFDIGTDAASLLRSLCLIEKPFMIRFGMGNPQHILKIKSQLIDAFRHEKVFKFLHVPVQAGNNDVLRAMKRDYTVEQFKEVVDAFRKAIPDITIATDIICGFPNETDLQFMDTIKLLKEVKPDVMNISRYWARPGTAAAKMKQVAGGMIKERSRLLTEVSEEISLEQNKRWIGWEGDVFVDDVGKKGFMVGRNLAYKQVLLKNVQKGDTVRVKIVYAGVYDLRGEVV